MDFVSARAEAQKFDALARGFGPFSPFELLAAVNILSSQRMDMTLTYLDYCATREIFSIDQWVEYCPTLLTKKLLMHRLGPTIDVPA